MQMHTSVVCVFLSVMLTQLTPLHHRCLCSRGGRLKEKEVGSQVLLFDAIHR